MKVATFTHVLLLQMFALKCKRKLKSPLLHHSAHSPEIEEGIQQEAGIQQDGPWAATWRSLICAERFARNVLVSGLPALSVCTFGLYHCLT